MSDTPSTSPVVQALQTLVSGGGYRFYDNATTARADDLLVRAQASASLGQAVTALKRLEADFARRFLPPPTREQPYPPADVMERRRELVRLRERVSGLEGDIRGMAVPTQDKVWWRFRQETRLLQDLLAFDHGLLLHTSEAARQAQALTPEAWQAQGDAPALSAALDQLEAVIGSRQQHLSQLG